MARIPNIYGGGAQTNINGLGFERDTSLIQIIELIEGIIVIDNKIYKEDVLLGENFSKHSLYSKFLTLKGINYKDYISSQLLPDDAFIIGNTCYII